ncbi:hypothetical protein M413DRAFT_13132 [Hebeloma cylindrosporum]|uniref:Uncharacterized protein n=1 Tax=Hebeloma cylindrosporum TaxID=76867 RepID=A0A0C3C111_HEBCY|nr:hypothetical protein M413DRAFT_13132 [Hebeloma cylindrosporum h7]
MTQEHDQCFDHQSSSPQHQSLTLWNPFLSIISTMDLSLLTPDQINQLWLLLAPAASQLTNPNPTAVTTSQPVQAALHTIPHSFGQHTPFLLPQSSQPPAPAPLTIASTPIQIQASSTPPVTQIYTGNHVPSTSQPTAPAPPNQLVAPAIHLLRPIQHQEASSPFSELQDSGLI